VSSFFERVIRAMRLEKSLYEEVEADRTATGQAMAVVILNSVAGGIGFSGLSSLRTVFITTLLSLAIWVVSAVIIFIVGTRLLPAPETRSDPGELMRTIGFAQSPGLLYFLALVPFAGWAVKLAVPLWLLAAWVIAVRQALDYASTGRAVLVCVIGWLFYVGGIYLMTVLFAWFMALAV